MLFLYYMKKKFLFYSGYGVIPAKLNLKVKKCLQVLLMTQMVCKTDHCFKSSMCFFRGHPQCPKTDQKMYFILNLRKHKYLKQSKNIVAISKGQWKNRKNHYICN